MMHTLYFDTQQALVKIQCTDEAALDAVLDDMIRIDAKVIPPDKLAEGKVTTLLSDGPCTEWLINKSEI